MTKIYIILTLLILLFSFSCTDRIVFEEEAKFNQDDLIPVFSPPGSTYHIEQYVKITTLVEGATIRYTLDGTEPKDSSPVYSDSIYISMNTTINAQALKQGWDTKSSQVEYKFQTTAPAFNPPGGAYDTPQFVEILCETPGAVIRYTIDGSEPDTSSTLFLETILVNRDTTLKAKAYRTGWLNSQITTASYQPLPVGTPTFDPPGGTYHNVQNVTIYCATEGATIRYTTDGTEPDTSSLIYSTPIAVTVNTTIKARAFKNDWGNTSQSEYNLIVAAPTFNPPAGGYAELQRVSISCATEEATIRYTTDGNEPTSSSTVYSVPIDVPLGTTLKAKGFKEGWTSSQTVSAEYTFFEDPFEMVMVEGGTFNPSANYTVTLSSFNMGKYEVTQSEYQSVMGTNPSHFSGNPNRPVETVNWFDAIEYCNRLSIREGLIPVYSYATHGTNPDNWLPGWNTTDANHTNVSGNWNADGYRLPTEMEWEFAARGGVPAQDAGTFNTTYAGSNSIDDVAWYTNNSGSRTHDVGTKTPNELGLYDMSGNVFEWNWDIYGGYPTGAYNDPKGASSGSTRVLRGGSWDVSAIYCRVDVRTGGYAAVRHRRNGFRVSRTLN